MPFCQGKCHRYRMPTINFDYYAQGFNWCTCCQRPIPHEQRHTLTNGTEPIVCNCCNRKTRVSAEVKGNRKNENIFACHLTSKQVFIIRQQAPCLLA